MITRPVIMFSVNGLQSMRRSAVPKNKRVKKSSQHVVHYGSSRCKRPSGCHRASSRHGQLFDIVERNLGEFSKSRAARNNISKKSRKRSGHNPRLRFDKRHDDHDLPEPSEARFARESIEAYYIASLRGDGRLSRTLKP
jgi:hypothetical protein